MKTLTIFRHAKSSWNNPELPDHDRPLNRRGNHDAPVMGERLVAAGIRPSLIVSSSAARAMATARLVARAIGYPVEFLHKEPALYHAGPNRIFDVIAAQDGGFNNLMIVGHNPGFTDFANVLVPGLTDNIPTAGFVSVQVDSDDWDLRSRRSVELIEFDYPKRTR
jgi:phosphohistidine phosphatase